GCRSSKILLLDSVANYSLQREHMSSAPYPTAAGVVRPRGPRWCGRGRWCGCGVRGAAAGRHEPCLVGEHDRLDAVTKAKLREHPADMRLDRCLRNEQPVRDLGVAQ